MTSKGTVFAVVCGLIAIVIAMAVGAFLLLMTDRSVPGEVWTVLGTALGGLTGLLASTRTEPAPPVVPPQVGAPK